MVRELEADMAELEIDKEDVHDRSKWRSNVIVYEEEVQPYRKTDYKPIIYKLVLFCHEDILSINVGIYTHSHKFINDDIAMHRIRE